MTGGIGEWGAPVPASPTAASFAAWTKAQDMIAAARWRNENAAGSLGALTEVVNAYEAMDAKYGIKDLRWRVQHGDAATPELLARLKAVGGGVSMSGHRWTGTGTAPYRLIVDSGIPHALHQDGVHIAPLNPWFAIYFATTGINFAGAQTNPGQSITRVEALRAFTRGAAWYMSREDDLGSIEVGKLGDLVVLDRDYLTVSDAAMRLTRPLLTVVGGKVVYDAGVL
jgi:predicted amidohydrolase YtcJ